MKPRRKMGLSNMAGVGVVVAVILLVLLISFSFFQLGNILTPPKAPPPSITSSSSTTTTITLPPSSSTTSSVSSSSSSSSTFTYVILKEGVSIPFGGLDSPPQGNIWGKEFSGCLSWSGNMTITVIALAALNTTDSSFTILNPPGGCFDFNISGYGPSTFTISSSNFGRPILANVTQNIEVQGEHLSTSSTTSSSSSTSTSSYTTSTLDSTTTSLTETCPEICTALFEVVSYGIFISNDTVNVVVEDIYSPGTTMQFTASFANGPGYSNTVMCTQVMNEIGQITKCVDSGVSPAIFSGGEYGITINAINPGNTELMITQSWQASYLLVSP